MLQCGVKVTLGESNGGRVQPSCQASELCCVCPALLCLALPCSHHRHPSRNQFWNPANPSLLKLCQRRFCHFSRTQLLPLFSFYWPRFQALILSSFSNLFCFSWITFVFTNGILHHLKMRSNLIICGVSLHTRNAPHSQTPSECTLLECKSAFGKV